MSSPAHCRHRRPRRLIAATFAAAVLVLTFASGLRAGTAVGSMDALTRTETCTSARG